MAEAFAILGVVQAAISLVSYGAKIVKRMDEFNHNVKGLPESFAKIRTKLPMLLDIVEKIQNAVSHSKMDGNTESLLRPVLDGLRKEIVSFDETLLKVLPSPHASNKEKITKAIRSVGIQKRIDEFSSSIQDYLSTLMVFQTTSHADSLRTLTVMVQGRLERPVEPPSYENSLQSAPEPKMNPIWTVKYDLEADFVGRDGIMSTIEGQLTEGNRRAALAGIGGVGKSRIAIQYSHRYRQLHPKSHIFWVHGGSRSRFETDYRNIARLLDLPGREDPDVDILRLVTDWLSDEANGSWLVILDNADDRDLWLGSNQKVAQTDNSSMPLIHYLPRCSAGSLLATTRDRQLGHQLLERRRQPLSISRLEPEEAHSLLSAKLSDQQLDSEDIEKLARELEYLPLTITQAAAYLEQTEISALEYLEIFRAGQVDIPNLLEESIYDPSRDYESSNSVFQTWRLSFEQLTRQSPKAADMLSLMAVLDRQAIPSELVQTPGGSVLDQKAAIAKLKAFSLIQEESSSNKYSLHRLVQLSTQRWLADHNKLSHWQKVAIGAVARKYPEDVAFDQWALIQDLSSHVQTVLAYGFSERTPLIDRAHILQCLGHYTMEQGQMTAALQILLESHRLRESQLGSEDELTLATLGLVGLAYSRLHQLKSARKVLQQFHDSTNRVLGPRHRLTLKSKSRLAVCYGKEGKLRKAKHLSLEALQEIEAEFGPDSEDALRVLTNLAYYCNRLRHWREAEDIGLRVLKQRMGQQGPDHPDTLTIMAALAWTYREQSRFQEAEELNRKTLVRRLEILGPDHPKTQLAMGNLAETCGLVGDWERAKELQKQVVEAKRRTLGAQHGSTEQAERYLMLVETVLVDERNELDAVRWLTKGGGRGQHGPSVGKRWHSTKFSSHDSHDSVLHDKNGSKASIPRFSSGEGITTVRSSDSDGHSRASSSTDPELQDAHNEVTRTLQAIQEAQAQLARRNRDLAQHIQEYARGSSSVGSAGFNSPKYDQKDHAYANLREAQTEYEGAKERVRILLKVAASNGAEGAKPEGQPGS